MSAATTFSSFSGTTSTVMRIQKSKKYSSSSCCFVRISARAATTETATEEGRGRRMGLYGVLGVKKTASTAEIKTAYRALAKQYHPDVIGSSSDQLFMEIHNAYSTLSDPKEREKYDASSSYTYTPGGFGGGLNNNNKEGGGGVDGGRWFRSSRRWETDQCW